MMFSRFIRPAIRQISAAANSKHCFNRILTPVTACKTQTQVNVDNGIQVRGYRRTFDVSHLEPLNFDYSEDLVKEEPLDEKELVFKYRDIPEIEGLPENVKRQFTLEYASSTEKFEHRNAVLLDKVSKLVGPGPCLEKEICYLTVKIRRLIPHIVGDRRNKRQKSYLIERIGKRKKLLAVLRRMDYDRFIWLLQELKIAYSQPDPYAYYKHCKTSKRAVRLREARDYTISEKKRKMEELKVEIEKEKEEFMVLKAKILEQIDKDVIEYSLDKKKILTKFEQQLEKENKEKLLQTKRVTKMMRYKLEMKEKRERESRVF